MEFLKTLLSSKTAHGRVIRTFIQAFMGLSVAIVAIVAFPDFNGWFGQLEWVAQVGGVAGIIAAVTAVQNGLEKLWETIKDW